MPAPAADAPEIPLAQAASPPSDPAGESLRAVERVERFTDEDLHALCEATHAAIIEGGGFGWVNPPGHRALESYYRGVLLVPERALFLARLNGSVVGAAQLVRPPRNNEAQAFAATLMHSFVAPYARGHGLARLLTGHVEESARALGYQVLNLDVRESQAAALRLYESMGFVRWGVHPAYARVGGRTVRGFYYYKLLQVPARRRAEAADGPEDAGA